jgi:hypothetical protein
LRRRNGAISRRNRMWTVVRHCRFVASSVRSKETHWGGGNRSENSPCSNTWESTLADGAALDHAQSHDRASPNAHGRKGTAVAALTPKPRRFLFKALTRPLGSLVAETASAPDAKELPHVMGASLAAVIDDHRIGARRYARNSEPYAASRARERYELQRAEASTV